MTKNKYSISGFTLAEVLITLGIIGIVAAMTLPALVNITQGKELETRLKKSYSVLQNAFNQMSYDEGQTINNTNYGAGKFMPVFKKYFKIAKDCGTVNCEKPGTSESGMANYSENYKTYNNKNMQNAYLDDGQALISDGMLILIENNNRGIFLSVDVNGINKKPNRWGHDLFTFQVTDNGKLLPMGADGTKYNSTDYCSATSSITFNGIGCTYRALTDKNYFKNLPK